MTGNVVRTAKKDLAKAAGNEVKIVSDQERLDAELIAKGQLAHRIEEIKHPGQWRPERLSVADEVERRPALRFIWEHCKDASAKVALETICHVMEGARSDYEREQNGLAFLDAINRCDDTAWSLQKTNHILHDFDGYEKFAVAALTTLAPRISDPLKREPHLRSAALNGPKNDDPAYDIAQAWKNTILEIYKLNPQEANERAAKAYSQAAGDSMIARAADEVSRTDYMRRVDDRGFGSTGFPEKRQRHPGPGVPQIGSGS